jgi:branched-chain amino acid transport system permease protein
VEYLYHIAVLAGLYSIITMSLNIAVGFTGIPAFGHSAFYLIGAYTSALLALNFGMSPWLALPLAGFVGWISGWSVGFLSARLGGDFLALATFSFAVISHSVANNWTPVTRGPMGLPGIPSVSLGPWTFDSAATWIPFVFIVGGGVYVLCRRIVQSPYGRILKGIREDEFAASSLGLDVRKIKRQVLAFSGACAGIAGGLYAHYVTFIDPSSFTPLESFVILLMVVFGGMGSLAGAVVGASLLVLIPEALRFAGMPGELAAPFRQAVYGAILIILMIYRPQGLMGKYQWK